MDNEKPIGKKRNRHKNRRANDPIYRRVSSRRNNLGMIFKIIKHGEITKKIKRKEKRLAFLFDRKCLKLFGTTVDGFKKHIENQFTDTISWHNHGKTDNPDAWQLDHIIPIGSFDFAIEENFTKAFHYTNTQLLMSSEHMEKTPKEHKEQKDREAFVIAAKNVEFP